MADHCTFVNPLCPDDLCVLEYGHPFSAQGHHITGTMYGSANTSRADQLDILCDKSKSGWLAGYCAPQGTSINELIELGWVEQDTMLEDER